MKTTILVKLLVIMLVTTVIPLGILGYLSLQDAKSLGFDAASQAEEMGKNTLSSTVEMGDMAVEDATEALTDLAAQQIRLRAESTAKQLEIYIRENPDMTVEDLQNDPYFSDMAVQPVGETGYTAITDVDTLVCRFHASPQIANLDLHKLSEKLPGFWGIMNQTEGGVPAKGYYDWKEDDGTINEKYMYIAIVNATTADGVQFSVAATTYIDEFTSPMENTQQAIESKIEETKNAIATSNQETKTTIENRTEGMNTQNKIFVITGFTIIIVVIVSFLFARALTRPITELKEVAERVTNGDFNAQMPKVKSKDEIRDLTAAMEMLVTGFKNLKAKVNGKNGGNND